MKCFNKVKEVRIVKEQDIWSKNNSSTYKKKLLYCGVAVFPLGMGRNQQLPFKNVKKVLLKESIAVV